MVRILSLLTGLLTLAAKAGIGRKAQGSCTRCGTLLTAHEWYSVAPGLGNICCSVIDTDI